MSSLFVAIVTGTVVSVVSHLLTNRHQLLMKRELYREILYREKVGAYRQVYSAITRFLREVEIIEYGAPQKFAGQIDATKSAFRAVHQTIEDSSLFMPLKVFRAIRALQERTADILKDHVAAARRYNMPVDSHEDDLYILAGQEECGDVADILQKDLGVETLTKDLEGFFSTASLNRAKQPFWKCPFEGELCRQKSPAASSE